VDQGDRVGAEQRVGASGDLDTVAEYASAGYREVAVTMAKRLDG
jgi:hypothetical protein